MAQINLEFDPANFQGDPIDNPFMPLAPGNTWVYQDAEGVTDTVTVTNQTITIEGVECVVVKDIAREGNKILESTKDYFAQDVDGNVWYFGENTKEFLEDGGVSFAGTWRAGVDNAEAGIIMLADPQVGDSYFEENAPGVAVDEAKVLKTNASATVPFGSFRNCLETLNTSALLPGDEEHKFYAAGIGNVLTVAADGTREELISFTQEASLKQAMAGFGDSSSIDTGEPFLRQNNPHFVDFGVPSHDHHA